MIGQSWEAFRVYNYSAGKPFPSNDRCPIARKRINEERLTQVNDFAKIAWRPATQVRLILSKDGLLGKTNGPTKGQFIFNNSPKTFSPEELVANVGSPYEKNFIIPNDCLKAFQTEALKSINNLRTKHHVGPLTLAGSFDRNSINKIIKRLSIGKPGYIEDYKSVAQCQTAAQKMIEEAYQGNNVYDYAGGQNIPSTDSCPIIRGEENQQRREQVQSFAKLVWKAATQVGLILSGDTSEFTTGIFVFDKTPQSFAPVEMRANVLSP